jgi:hypothetical protein
MLDCHGRREGKDRRRFEATEGTLPEGVIPTSLIGDEGQQKILELLAFRVAQTAEMDAHVV